MKNIFKSVFSTTIVVGLLTIVLTSSTNTYFKNPPKHKFGIKDTIDDDSLKFPFKDYTNNPSYLKTTSPLFLKKPSIIKSSVTYDQRTGKFIFSDKIGNYNYRPAHQMTFSEYMNFQSQKSNKQYWQERSALENSNKGEGGIVDKLINPKLVVPIAGFEEIFGSNTITVKPQGSAELIFGLNISKVENPTLPEDLQKTVTFDFDQNIKMGINGMIGDKLKLGINYDTKATFEFENNVKLAYEGKEDDIIQKIEAGNVSLPLSGTLITGSHSLFGIKTELKFGKLTITSVASQQKGEIKTIEVQGGAISTPFEITSDNYESGKHFFLAQYFRDNYNEALKELPIIRSNINITRVEVWVTNRSATFENSRNIVAFTDLGESHKNMLDSTLFGNGTYGYPQNGSNGLYNYMNNLPGTRQINSVSSSLASIEGFNSGEDYEKVQNARLLSQSDYTLNSSLGYISLNSALNNDEVLAVAFEYTAGGKTYKVGEFSNESPAAPQNLFLKLLKPTMLSTNLPTWKLMMKNVYSIDAFQVNSEDFTLEIMYRDDKTGTSINYIPAGKIDGDVLLKVMGLDNLNKKNEPGSDGFFDFIDKVTINASNGRIYFPTIEPFGKDLREKITGNSNDPELNRIADQYTFPELYSKTQSQAKQLAEKNKFFLKGTYRSAGGSEISLNAMNVPEGSVKVTAGGRELVENTDYTVDYNLGRVTIINQGLLESGTPIKISLESNSMFNIGTKTFFGTHLDYKFNKDFNIGATVLHLNQKPLTSKITIGNEPISNTIWGLDMNYNHEVPFLTKMVDLIPFIETKETSTFDFTGEFAHIIPGHPSIIGDEGFAHIDDFEATKITLDLKTPSSWKLASTPQKQSDLFPEGELANNLAYGYNRARLAWYNVNVDFLRNSSSVPDYITTDDQSDHRVREIYEQELFPDKDPVQGIPPVISVLNLAFYPQEKGPYNYDTNGENGISDGIESDGKLKNPQKRWGGIMRSLVTNDFEEANIEFVEFWLLDPFIYDNETSGDLYFNFGNISEDILRDSRQSFENGLPTSEEITDIDSSAWGIVPRLPRITDGFANDPATALSYQDVGLDGLSDKNEKTFFANYLDSIAALYGTNSQAYIKASADPSNDDYLFFKASKYDTQKASILERYKKFNNQEQNTSTTDANGTTSSAGQQTPDMEDINNDYTLSENETYFQYKVHLSPNTMQIGENYITDIKESNPKLKNGKTETVKWYHFKIPLADYDKRIGQIQDFKSIRFARMFLKGWNKEIILRFADLYLVKGEWRKYNMSLLEGQEGTGGQITDAPLDISAVNIEENASREPVNYILPPDVTREISPDQQQIRELNEQSIALKTIELSDGDARAAYKNVSLDVRQFKNIQMYIHAEAVNNEVLNDNDVCAFIRLGSDYKENYYEYEIPLKVTEPGTYTNGDINEPDRLIVWPKENMLDISFEVFQGVKQRRNSKIRESGSNLEITSKYSEYKGENKVTVLGNPNLSNVRTIMIGIRNRSQEHNILPDDGLPKSVEVWMNELRLAGFNEQGGWASQARISTKLADFSTISLAGNYSTPGFGSIEKRVSERQKSTDFGYDFSSNVEFGKFFPKKYGVRLPFYVGYSENFSNPQYDPLDPDILLETTISDPNMTQADRDSILKISQDYVKRRSINFTNINIKGNSEKKKNTTKNKNKGRNTRSRRGGIRGGAQKPFYHISNFTASYGFSEIYIRNINTDHNIYKEHTGSFAYNYNNRPRNFSPFSKIKFLRYKPLQLIKDFNFYLTPALISFRTDMRKKYNEVQLRNIENPDIVIPTTFDKQFTWNRVYDVRYNITKSLKLTYNATNAAWIDEPYGRLDKGTPEYEQKVDTIWNNIKNLGRTSDFTQKINATWTVPINKLPLLDWTSANARYGADYYWSRGPETTADVVLGNTIRNAQNLQLSAQLNTGKLYRKIKFLKKADDRFKKKKSKKKKYKSVKYEKDKVKLRKNRPYIINHKLNDKKAKLTITDSKRKKVSGKTENINENRIKFTPDTTINNIKILVKGKQEIKESIARVILDYTLFTIMSLRNVSATFSQTNGTVVPGYIPETQFFGFNDTWQAPGWQFIAGIQDDEFGQKAAINKWLSGDTLINSPVIMNNKTSYSVKATLKPFKGLRIDLTADKTINQSNREFWVFRDGSFSPENRMLDGNFSMSFLAIKTSMWSIDNDNYNSKAYDNFLKYRKTIATRISTERAGIKDVNYNPALPNPGDTIGESYPYGFSSVSQEVMLPAFLAAYSDQNPSTISTKAFPTIPLPNWRLKYDGLTYFDFISKFLKKVTINHGYRSNYSVNSYATNPNYNFEEESVYGYSFAQDSLSEMFIPAQQIQGVVIDEKFIPFLGIDMTWKNSLSTKIEYKQARNLALSFANNQILEMLTKEYTVGLGYKIPNLELPISIGGSNKLIKSDLNLRVDFTYRDMFTVVRRILESDNQLSVGQQNMSIKFNADYDLNKTITVRIFYDQTINTPRVSTSYRTSNTKVGFSIRFNLIGLK